MCLKILWFLAKHKENPLKNPQGDTWGFFWIGQMAELFCSFANTQLFFNTRRFT